MQKFMNRFAPYLFILAAVVLCVIGTLEYKKQKSYSETDATIVSIVSEDAGGTDNDTMKVTVSYTVDGKQYEGELGSYNVGMKEGASVKIKYDPENPESITKSGMLATSVVFLMAVICVGAGIWMFVRRREAAKAQTE